MTYKEFRIKTIKADQKKHHFKVYNSYGIKDAYRWSIKNKLISKDITEKMFRVIIKALHSSLQDQLLQGRDINLPYRMGRIEIRKIETQVKFVDGKIKTNLSIDWGETLKFWFEDKEASDNKTLIRNETKEKFKIIYNKHNAVYNNKVFYEFTPTRDIKLKLKERIINDGFDALLFDNKHGLHKYKYHS